MNLRALFLRFLLLAGFGTGQLIHGAELRLGIIGTDTSHAVAFTQLFNDPAAKGHVAGGKVVAAFRGGSPDIPESWDRVDKYAETLRSKYGVQFYDSIPEVCRHVDGVLLESVDGRPHLEQVKPVLAARKPVFIDKPMAGSLRDVLEIFRLAKAAKVPVFSSSALRFAADTQAVSHGSIGRVAYAETYGPCELEPHHPDLFWYGVHGVEALETVMGTGAKQSSAEQLRKGELKLPAPGRAAAKECSVKTRSSTAWPEAPRARRRWARSTVTRRWSSKS
jgi:Oxidoreductase family, NAD-binding Rossmann fold